MNDPEPRATDWYTDHLTDDADAFAIALEAGPLDAPVGGCPGWSLGRLAEHTGQIHRWAGFCAANGRAPSADEAAALESYAADDAAGWMRRGAATLADTLGRLDPDAPTWHPFPLEQVGRVWPRRMAHETAMHRWDAQLASGAEGRLDPELASDGIDEYFEMSVPRILAKGGVEMPSGSLHVHCTDVPGEWLVWSEGGEYRMIRAHEKGDAALRGPADAILLRLWNRSSGRSDELSPVGDSAVLDAWLAIAGM